MASSMIPPDGAADFLVTCGWPGARIEPLAGDASFRRYFRVILGEQQAVLMDAPPPHEDPRPFIAVAEWLQGLGLTSPSILGRDLDRGLLLLDHLGSDRFKERLDSDPHLERELYEGATDLLVRLHGEHPMPGLQSHGLAQWLDELDLFIDWYGPAVGLDLDRDSWRGVWTLVLSTVEGDGLGPVTVLRDYHAENVMLVAGREGVERLGLLDFQDALAGHPAYDLASMLEDARRDVPPVIERAMIDRYKAATGQGDDFERAYWSLAAQRNTRILGVFVRLWKRDGKPHYRSFQPRMWGLLERDLAAPGLEVVRDWFDRHVPAEKRAAAWEKLA
jgi:aminoglycoside/choline kinase family phosphotransferase